MHTTRTAIISSIIALSGCGGSTSTPTPNEPAPTQSEFRSFDTVGDGLDRSVRPLSVQSTLNGIGRYRLTLGKVTDDSFDGYAAYANVDTNFSNSAPTSGSVTYGTRYRVFEMTDMTERPDDFGIHSDPNNRFETQGTINITANFDDGTVTGTSDLLTVEATLDEYSNFTGTATWRGVEADLQGGAARNSSARNTLIGAFHGSNDETVFAGALVGYEPQP